MSTVTSGFITFYFSFGVKVPSKQDVLWNLLVYLLRVVVHSIPLVCVDDKF